MNQIQMEVNEFFGEFPEEYQITGTYGKKLIIGGGDKEDAVGIPELAEYFATQANNIVSGMRTLGNHVGDWRPIDNIAQDLHGFFKAYYPDRYRNYVNKHYSHIMRPGW
jgi:hypothetical protein